MTEAQILLVDDKELNREILLEYFAGESVPLPDTADGGESACQIREGLEADAYYCLTKPYRRDDLPAIVQADLADLADANARDALRQKLNQHIDSLQFLNSGEFTIRTIDDPGQFASFIAQACPDSDMAVVGISELLINGSEHGNLGLSYADKSMLKREDNWQTEIDRHSLLPENLKKSVRVSFLRQAEQIVIRVAGQAQGFNWRAFLEKDPQRAFDPNDEGIALARMLSFSNICHKGCGHTAVATITSRAITE